MITATHITGVALTAAVTLGGALYARITVTLDNTAQTLFDVSRMVERHEEAISTLKTYTLERKP
jgi:hypothetical protein